MVLLKIAQRQKRGELVLSVKGFPLRVTGLVCGGIDTPQPSGSYTGGIRGATLSSRILRVSLPHGVYISYKRTTSRCLFTLYRLRSVKSSHRSKYFYPF